MLAWVGGLTCDSCFDFGAPTGVRARTRRGSARALCARGV